MYFFLALARRYYEYLKNNVILHAYTLDGMFYMFQMNNMSI